MVVGEADRLRHAKAGDVVNGGFLAIPAIWRSPPTRIETVHGH